jgi:hypothetical protein
MGVSAAAQLQARVRARARRLGRERDRFVRDARVEAAVVVALEALGERDSAWALGAAAEVRVGRALSAIIDEGVIPGRAARLCDLSPGEALRLRRAAQGEHSSRTGAGAPGADLNPPSQAAIRTASPAHALPTGQERLL